jgi:hypothetical protein
MRFAQILARTASNPQGTVNSRKEDEIIMSEIMHKYDLIEFCKFEMGKDYLHKIRRENSRRILTTTADSIEAFSHICVWVKAYSACFGGTFQNPKHIYNIDEIKEIRRGLA